MSTDTTTLKYVIDSFDQSNMVIQVSFPDDSTGVAIGLKSIPESQEELDLIVKPWATHQEVADTIAAVTPADISFLTSRIGVETTTTRFSVDDQAAATAALFAAQAATQATAPTPTNEFVIGATPEHAAEIALNTRAADVAYIKELIAEALAAQKA